MAKKSKKTKTKEENDITLELIKKMTNLATSGFGLVAALAWNNVINEVVNSYIKPYISKGSGIISLLIYAILITALAVLVTWNLSQLEQKFSEINRGLKRKINQSKNKQLKR